ncbi:hypothetical protein ACFL6E_05555, partial [Candidatus Neomarinimicrobiota bacterium]
MTAVPLNAIPTPIGTWTGGAGDNLWTSPSNWAGSVLPNDTTNVVIALEDANVQLPYGPITIASLTLGDGGGGTSTINTQYNYYQGGLRLTVIGAVTINLDGVLNLDGWGQGDR